MSVACMTREQIFINSLGIRPDGRDLGVESFFDLLPVEYVFSEKRLDGESEEERDFPTFLERYARNRNRYQLLSD